MKILRVIASMDPRSGGPCQGLRNSIPELSLLGTETEVVSLDDPGADFIGRDSFLIHALGKGKSPWQYNAKLTPWLLNNLGRFDAVVVHGLWLFHSYAVRNALRRLRKTAVQGRCDDQLPKVFVMPHGMLDPYFQKAPERKLKAIRNVVYYKLIESKVINEADAVFFTSEEELRLARLPFRPYRPKQAINIGYGIATPPSPSDEMKLAFAAQCPALQQRSYLLFLSRIHQKKGVALLLQAYKQLLDQHKQRSASASESTEQDQMPALVIAGPGLESAYGLKVKEMVTTLGLTHSVFFPGMLSGDAKWGAFYGCEAFILPSHQENFGIAVVEALACGKPVLISNKINIWREIVTAGAGLVEEDTLAGTSGLLLHWDQMHQTEKKEFGQRAKACFEANFAIRPAAGRMLNALKAPQTT